MRIALFLVALLTAPSHAEKGKPAKAETAVSSPTASVSIPAAAAVSASSFTWTSTAPLTLDAVLAQFERFDRELDSLTARFTQSLSADETGVSSSLEGSVSYLKPDRLRIEYLRPERQTVVSDGKDIYIHRHANAQVIQSKLEDWKQSDPLVGNLMQFGSYAKMLRSYDVSLDTGGASPSLRLLPKDRSAGFELRFELQAADLFPAKTELQVRNTRVRTDLDAVCFNPALRAKDFDFTPPAGAEIFRDFKPPRFQP